MRSFIRVFVGLLAIATIAAAVPGSVSAQHRPSSPPPRHQPAPRSDHRRAPYRPAVRGSFVFIGGYFYDPYFGPYPWWGRTMYPYAYYPVYDDRAVVRVIATPKDAAVYADGFYAGTVHDFNDWFEGLPLAPGGHEVVLYLEGYRTIREHLYLAPGSTVKLHRTMEPLPHGVASEPPRVAPLVPAPPSGTYMAPRTPRPGLPVPQDEYPTP